MKEEELLRRQTKEKIDIGKQYNNQKKFWITEQEKILLDKWEEGMKNYINLEYWKNLYLKTKPNE